MSATRANLLLLLVAFFWGSTFTMIKESLDHVPPATFIALRFTLATILLGLCFKKYLKRPTREELTGGVLIGLVTGVGFVTQTIGLQTTTAGKAGFITGLYVVIVPLFSAPYLKQVVTKLQWAGVVVATFGLGMLSLNEQFRMQTGDLWVLCCAILYAFQVLFISRYANDRNVFTLTFIEVLVIALVAWIWGVTLETPTISLPLETWGAVVFTAVFATVVAFLIQMWAQPKTNVTAASLIMSLEAVIAALVGWLWAGEVLSTKEFLGCILMLLGMVLVQLDIKDLPSSVSEKAQLNG